MAENPGNQIAIFFAIGTAGMLFLAGVIVLFVFFHQKKILLEQLKLQNLEADYQQKMLGAALDSQENERVRVSKDIHDDIGMMLMTMRTYVNSLTEKSLNQGVTKDMRSLIDETHEKIRRISWDLMPSTLVLFGLVKTIAEMCQRLSMQGSTPVIFIGENLEPTLNKEQETLLYRIIQEGVTNALRHAKATKIEIRMVCDDSFLEIFIADDGIGFDFPDKDRKGKAGQGVGLLSIESRINMLKAQMTYSNNAPSGTILHVKLRTAHGG